MAQNNLGQNQVFPIYQANGQPFHNLSLKKSTLELTGMNLGDKITGDVLYNGTLTFTMREYIECKRNPDDENEVPVRFILINPPTQTRNGLVKDTSSDAGMTKYTFVFYHPMALLSSMDFNDVAVSGNEKRYLSESRTFSWIGKIPDYCRKLNKNLEGTEWVCYVGSSVDEAMLNKLSEVLPFDNATIADALKTFYDTWEVPYIVDSITSVGQYIDPVTYEDYYTMGKRFVIILGYPSNEITNTVTTSYNCDVQFSVGLYHNATPIALHSGSFASVDANHYIYSSELQPIGQTYTAEGDVYIYVAAPYVEAVQLSVTAPYVFEFGQGLGLKNNSRTPKNNKIVTRIVGYGSEDNIPYGYPQIRWYGDQRWEFTKYVNDDPQIGADGKPHGTPTADAYPLYMGILGGQYVKLIKHPFTRNHLMPSVYRETLFNKISPYNTDGTPNDAYDPDTTLVDYYDSVDIDPTAPSVEVHQFEDVKPELGDRKIIRVLPYNDREDVVPMSNAEFAAFVQGKIDGSSVEKEKGFLKESFIDTDGARYYKKWVKNSYESSVYKATWTRKHDEYCNIVEYSSSSVNFKRTILKTDGVYPPVEWDDTMDDDGNYKQSHFKMTLPTLPFDLYACAAITQEMKIAMRSGACIGCTFTVMVDWEDYKLNFYDLDGNFAPDGEQRDLSKYPNSQNTQVTLILQKDNETFGTLMPNVYQQPKGEAQVEEGEEADKFVILGISLPDTYITDAEVLLDGDAREYMLENSVPYYEYPLQFDEHFLTTHANILAQLKQNTIVRFMFNGFENTLYIKQMSIKFGDGVLPKYDITLADDIEIVLNQIGQTTEDVSRVRVQMNEMQKYYGEDQAIEIANRLSKVADDIALGVITFQAGLQSVADAIFHAELRSPDFEDGMSTGRGWRIDASGNIEADTLKLRSSLIANELLVNRLTGQEGDTIFSDNDVIENVEMKSDVGYTGNTLYFLSLKERWTGYVTNQRTGNILRGIINTLGAKQAGVSDVGSAEGQGTDGENKYYTSWMLVKHTNKDSAPKFSVEESYDFGDIVDIGVDEETALCVFIAPHYGAWIEEDVIRLRPNLIVVSLYDNNNIPAFENVRNNFPPCDFMSISRWGHIRQSGESSESAERLQRSFYISTTEGRITKLRGVTHPILTDSNYGTTLGTLPNFVKNLPSLQNRLRDDSDYLYAQGIVVRDFIKIGNDQYIEYVQVDMGEWDANKTYLYEQYNETSRQWETHNVWHDGAYWRNTVRDNTGSEPTVSSNDWQRLMKSGESAPEFEVVEYAWSNVSSTPSELVPPESGLSWSSNIPSNTGNLAHLWRKSTKKILVNDEYVVQQPRYMRLSGTDGTSIHTNGTAVDYVSSPPNFRTDVNDGDKGICEGIGYIFTYSASQQAWVQSPTPLNDGDAYTLQYAQHSKNGHLLQWSVEANNWIDLGQFQGQSGLTYYTHVVWAENIDFSTTPMTIEGYAQTKAQGDTTHIWMGVYADLNNQDPTSGTDPILQQYEWTNIKGESGYSTVTLTLYQRSATAPTEKPASLTYIFATGALIGNLGRWSRTMPSTEGNPCYSMQVSIRSQAASVEIYAADWGDVVKLVEDGAQGKMGKNFYYGGVWDTARTDKFKATDQETPYFTVYVQGQGSTTEERWLYVGDNFGGEEGWTIAQIAQGKGAPSNLSGNWEIMVTDFKYLISEAIFSAFAKLGKWTFNDEYMFSEMGIDRSGNVVPKGSLTYNGIGDSGNQFTPSAAFDALTGQTSLSRDKVRFNPDGSGWLANRNIEWGADGSSAFKGGLRSPFTRLSENDPTSLSDYSDNVAVLSLSETQNTQYALKWDISQSGRRLTLVDYQWQGSEGSEGKGTSEIQVPNELADMWFFQNGIRTKSLKISREGVELLGYGDQDTFYGWIVINRFDIMTLRKYGAQMKQLICVSASYQYREGRWTLRSAPMSFDGTPVTASVQSVGIYNITWNADWFNEIADMVVQATVEYRSGYHLAINAERVSRRHVRLHIYDIGTNAHVDSGFCLTISNAADMSTLQ